MWQMYESPHSNMRHISQAVNLLTDGKYEANVDTSIIGRLLILSVLNIVVAGMYGIHQIVH
jgi:hypothetical protein